MNDAKLGRYISFLLRHCPESLNLQMDKEGYVFVDELIEKINSTNKYKDSLNKEILARIVKEDNKQRYSYNENKTKIRCVQGHSFHVDVAKEALPPKVLFHGTSKSSYEIIKNEGVKKVTRDYVHLSRDIYTAYSNFAKTTGFQYEVL